MHLKKGICFFCPNSKVVRQSTNQELCKMITLLLSKELLNSTELDRIQASLRFCPICYHKLIIADRTRKNIKPNGSNEISANSCLLCKNEENLFKINEWPSFKKITEDLSLSRDRSCVTCSDCLYYLEIKNEIKTKLFSKYPKLKVNNISSGENGRKLKPKFVPRIKLKSVPLLGKSKRKFSRKRKFSEMVTLTGDSSTDLNINFDTIKKFKPLKDHILFRNLELVKTDSKFLNQVPYVLVSIWNSPDSLKSTDDKNAVMECDETFIDLTLDEDMDSSTTESNNFQDNNVSLEPATVKSNIKLDNEIKKRLVVNLLKTNIEQYIKKTESEPDIQNLVDETEENEANDSCLAPDNCLEEAENKNKRKSVSFAEEKNVEIEYFENESNIKFGDHSNSIKDPSQATSKKYSKGILKRDDNVNVSANKSESKNDSIQVIEETEEALNGKENHEEILNVDSSSDNENLFDSFRSKNVSVEEETAIAEDTHETVENISNKRKNIANKSRPKPLSKKKRRGSIAEDCQDSDTEDHIVVTNDEQKTSTSEVDGGDNLEEGDSKKIAKRSKPKPLSKKKRRDSVAENYLDSTTNDWTTDDDNVATNDEQEPSTSEVDREDKIEDDDSKKIVKKSKPKPLSKKKRRGTITEDYQDFTATDDHNVVTNDEQRMSTPEDILEESDVCTPGVVEDTQVLDEEKPENEEHVRRLSNTEDEQEEILGSINIENGESANEDNEEFEDISEPPSKEKQTNTTDSEEEMENAEETEEDQLSRAAGSSPSLANVDSEVDTPSDSNPDKDEATAQIEEDIGTTVEQNETTPREEDEDKSSSDSQIKSTSSIVDDENSVEADNPTKALPFEENDLEEGSKSDNSANVSHDSIPNCDDTQLVDSYENSDDDDHFINSQNKEKTVLAIEKDEECNKEHDLSSDNNKIDLRFDDFDKNEDLGITDVDSENINSILSHIFPPELSDDRLLFDTSKNENDLEDATCGKHKPSEDETLNVSKEKKKKKVTFCDVT